MVKAFEDRGEHAPLWENACTVAAGIRVPAAIGDFLILRAVRESQGFAIVVEDEGILIAHDEIAKFEGLLTCPEGATTWEAYKQALACGLVQLHESASCSIVSIVQQVRSAICPQSIVIVTARKRLITTD